MSSTNPATYRRQTLLCAADMLKALGHSGLSRLLFELDLPDSAGAGSGLAERTTSLAKYAATNPEQLSPERRTIAYEIILRATQIWEAGTMINLRDNDRERFATAMEHQGQPIHRSDESFVVGGEKANNGFIEGAITFSGSELERLKAAVVGTMKTDQEKRSRKVFVVHGHDEGPREAVARLLERLGLEPIILHEQTNRGQTLIEKFVSHSEAAYAIVLLTPDDEGCEKGGILRERARQNVVFELGYFVGALGREKVIALRKGNVELPSDLAGVVYETIDPGGAWRYRVGEELRSAGFDIDLNKIK